MQVKVNLFPEEQKNIFNAEMANVKELQRQKHEENICAIRSRLPQKPDSESKIILGVIAGLILGVMIFGLSFLTLIISGMVGGIVGNYIKKSKLAAYEDAVSANNQLQQSENDSFQKKPKKYRLHITQCMKTM